MTPAQETTSLNRSDTGLWHLTVNISDKGVSAQIALKDTPEEAPRELMKASWNTERDGLMKRIENAIYDHPEVLDDYSATIVIETPRTLMVPKEEIPDDADAERLYGMAYKGMDEDVMVDSTGKESVLFTLCPGMLAFLRRTFPGARIRSKLGLQIEKARSTGNGIRIFVESSGETASVICLRGDALLSASVQSWVEWTDLAYRILSLPDIYGFKAEDTSVFIAAPENVSKNLEEFLSSKVAAVSGMSMSQGAAI